MSKKLYVGNLPFSVDLEALKKLFSEFGDIEDAVILSDKFTGKSRGFGFVTFADDAAGDKAISDMNEKDVEGRKLTVNEAKPMRDDSTTATPEEKPKKEEKVEEEPKEEAEEEKAEETPKEEPEKKPKKEKKAEEEKVEEKEE